MSESSLEEWRNSNAQRSYPFSDDMSRTAAEGAILSNDTFLDAHFHPIDLQGQLYLGRIDIEKSTVSVSDSGTGLVLAEAIIEPGEDLVFVDSRDRHVGILVVGPGFLELPTQLNFTAETATFAPAAVFPMNQTGVRGFRLPDGTVVTGAVEFVGEEGIVVTTDVIDGQDVIFINAIGVPSQLACDAIGPAITCIAINQLNLGGLTISRTGNEIFLGLRNELVELCRNKERLPDDDGTLPLDPGDPCEDPDAPKVPDPFPPFVPPAEECEAHGGRYFITSVTDALEIHPEVAINAPTFLQGLSAGDIQRLLAELPPRNAQGLKLVVRGIADDE